MKKFLQSVPSALIVAVLVAAIASASPKFSSDPEPEPVPVTGPSGPSGPSGSDVSPEVADVVEPEDDEGDLDVSDEGAGPDFSSCVGLRGLDNAVCRHEVLLETRPDNQGLQNAMDHLVQNQAKHEEHAVAGHGNEDASHGNADATHGNGDATHGPDDDQD